MTAQSRRRRAGITGITVYQRGKGWSYRIDLEPDSLTGKRQRENRGGFDTEDEAWTEAVTAKAALEAGRHVKASRRTVRHFAAEWLASIEHSIKPSTYTNYVDYLDAYVLPIIGDRRLQDISVTVLNAFSRHLLEKGRCKPNNNAAMYKYWIIQVRKGNEPTAREVAAASKTTIHAARAAVRRFRGGRTPKELSTGLSPKTVRNIQNMLHKAFGAAAAWRYIDHNPTEHVSKPRIRRKQPATWNADELGIFLKEANRDRFRALWMLVATSGLRRSELAGAERNDLNFTTGTLNIAATRVVVAGKPVDEDGKTDNARRVIALDADTLDLLHEHLKMLDEERAAWGPSYPNHGKLFSFEDGRPIHPDTITRRFNRIVDRTGLPRITLHGVRHSYATVCVDDGINPKVLSERIGHANVAFTMQKYVQRTNDLTRDAAAATQIAQLITKKTKDQNSG